jgi:hypothetical protein
MRYCPRYISAVLLATYLSACTSWQVQKVAPEKTFSDPRYVRKGVRVTTLDNRRFELRQPELRNDSIAGRVNDTAEMAIPLQGVSELAVKRPDGGRTALLVLGSAAAVAGVGLAVACIVACNQD